MSLKYTIPGWDFLLADLGEATHDEKIFDFNCSLDLAIALCSSMSTFSQRMWKCKVFFMVTRQYKLFKSELKKIRQYTLTQS